MPRPLVLLVLTALLLSGCGTRAADDTGGLPGNGPSTRLEHDLAQRSGPPQVNDRPRPSRSASPVPTDLPPVCVSGLSIRPGVPDAAMGARYLGIGLLNCGTKPYRIKGYPVVRALDATKVPFDLVVNEPGATPSLPDNFAGPPKEVVLQPGESAHAMLAWRVTVTDWETATEATYLDVAPAAGQTPQLVTAGTPYEFGNTGHLTVSAWIKLAK